MNKAILLILLATCCVSARLSLLDSLVTRTHNARMEAKKSPGFIHLTPPDSLFKTIDTVKPFPASMAPTPVAAPAPPMKSADIQPASDVSPVVIYHGTGRVDELSKRVDALEISVNKVSSILDNMQTQTEFNTKHIDQTAKTLQIISGIIGGIAAVFASILGLVKLLKGKG